MDLTNFLSKKGDELMAKENINSYIGENSSFEGSFYISGSIKIDGKFKGDIQTEGILHIGETGDVQTNIKSKKAVISGKLVGNIEALEEVVLEETCRVVGDIKSPVVNIAKGSILQGNINITGKSESLDSIANDG